MATRDALGRRERRQVGRHLQRELARRHEDECAGALARPGRPLDERQAEGERLAGAGRRLGEDVEAGERVRKDEVLDGKGMGDAGGGERPNDGCADAELLK